METAFLAKVIRIKNCHLKEIKKVFDLDDAINFLTRSGFSATEESSDGFYTTYECPERSLEQRSTLVYFSSKGYFVDACFPESN